MSSILKNEKNKKFVIIAAILVLSIVSFMLLRPKPQLEPVKTYKAVTPTPKPSLTETTRKTETTTQHGHDHGHSHDHNHNTDSHSHTVEPSASRDQYDWQNDSSLDSTLSKNDPWKQTYPESESTDDADDPYPPRDWYKTEDPELYIEYLQAQLIKQFGDIPEVHTFVAFRQKIQFRIPIKDADEYLNFLKAQYTLWPMEETRKTLETLEKRIEEGANIVFVPMEAP